LLLAAAALVAGARRLHTHPASENIMSKTLTGAEHHDAAAVHHEQAAVHHREAARYYAQKDYAHAAHEALIAHGHTQQAMRHGNEATKYHVEHHGKVAAE
jgi:hypothetical protein